MKTYKTYEECAKEYGTVTYNNKRYALAERIYLSSGSFNDNYNRDALFMANAIDEDGKEYLVIWKPSRQWELSYEYSDIASQIALLCDCEKEQAERRMAEIEAEIEEIGGFVNIDNEYACDWETPYMVV